MTWLGIYDYTLEYLVISQSQDCLSVACTVLANQLD